MIDDTEELRRKMCEMLSQNPLPREVLAGAFGEVWNTDELKEEFEVLHFMAPYAVVRRKSDRKKGSILFQHKPRLYFGFKAYEENE